MNHRRPSPTPFCAVYAPLLSLLSLDELEPDQLSAVQEHLATCEYCQAELRAYKALQAALRDQFGRKDDEPIDLPSSDRASDRAATRLERSAITWEDIMKAAERESDEHEQDYLPSRAPMTPRVRVSRIAVVGAIAALVILAVLATTLFAHFAPLRPGNTATPTPTVELPSQFRSYPLPTSGAGPLDIKRGPDGNFWFVEFDAGKIGKITPSGVITEYPLPDASSQPSDIVLGPDGNMWFTEWQGNAIGRITPAGAVTEFTSLTRNTWPFDITLGPDGNLWFTENKRDAIGRITPVGVITEFQVDNECRSDTFICTRPKGIVAGPDGALWFTMAFGVPSVGRITTSGVITTFPIQGESGSSFITAGDDGNLWLSFTAEQSTDPATFSTIPWDVGRLTTKGALTVFHVPTIGSMPTRLTQGPDHAIWFVENGGSKLGRVTYDGTVTEVALPGSNLTPSGLVAGPDGAIWMTAYATSSILVYTP
jgi:streptogramin lyase